MRRRFTGPLAALSCALALDLGLQAAIHAQGQAPAGGRAAGAPSGQQPPTPAPASLSLEVLAKPFTGDLDQMVKRRVIRVLVPYSKTFYFVDKGEQRGISYELMKKFEDEFNGRMKTGHLRVNVAFLPVSREELLTALTEGRGDVAAANLTVTPERLKTVDFAAPLASNAREVVVTGPRSPAIASIDDLAGQEVFVRRSSSYYESLVALNQKFKAAGKKEAVLRLAPEVMESEDLLEMLNGGLVKVVVVDHYLANFWKQVFDKLVVHENVVLRESGDIAFALRKNNPKLKAELDRFCKANRSGTLFGNVVAKKYLRDPKYVKDAMGGAEFERFKQVRTLLQTYAEKYQVDWLLMGAQGFQESGLDHSVRSPVGAVGVMQVMPATGKDLNVGDIRELEANIHAGVKYVRVMIDHYYKDEPMTDVDKMLFAFASYNAGPGRIRGLRKDTAARGLDPNKWFNNVERLAAEKIGRETVQYVSNIFKYYTAYRLALEQVQDQQRAKPAIQ